MTTKPETARALIDQSPIERTLIIEDPRVQEPKRTWDPSNGMRGTITTPVNPLPRLEATPTTDDSNELGLSHITFTIRCFPPNRTYNHLAVVRSDPLHGPWPDDRGQESFIAASLRRSVPAGRLAPALRDWVSGNQLSRDPSTPLDDAGEGALSILIGKSRAQIYIRERTKARVIGREIPEVMKSLSGFAAKCRGDPMVTDASESESSQASKSMPETKMFDNT